MRIVVHGKAAGLASIWNGFGALFLALLGAAIPIPVINVFAALFCVAAAFYNFYRGIKILFSK